MSTVKGFHYGDIVYRFNQRKEIIFGTVIGSYEQLQHDEVRVMWNLNNRRTISVWKQKQVRLMSRRIIPGVTVRRLENGTETRGYCKEVKQLATVQIVGTNKVIERVPRERLNALSRFGQDFLVCLDNRFGKIQRIINQKITMQSECGSTVEIFSSINREVVDFWRNIFYNYSYPGQEVICTPSNLEQPRWLQRSEAMQRSMETPQKFTVQKVEPLDIPVCWYDSMLGLHLADADIMKTEDIPRLKVVEPVGLSHLTLDRRRLLKLNFSDVLLTKKDWIRKQSVLHQPKRRRVLHIVNEELVPGNTVAVEALCIDSKVTIVWENGTIEEDIPTTLLYRRYSLDGQDGHEFFPGEWVFSDARTEKYGTVQHVNNLERIATVKWFTHNEGNEKPQLVSTNEMSAYDLRKHPKYKFRPRSVVKQIPIENDKFGTVLDSCPEGYVIVQWINGVQESCWPKNLELVDPTDYSDNEDDDEDNASSNSLPSLPATPEDSLKLKKSAISSESEVFTILDEAHFGHRFYSTKFRPTDKQKFVERVQKEFELLKESLPPGVWVRSYENRMDLLSVMIEGPKNTPYEDGLFLFDLQLSQDYPLSPPLCHYKSYSSEELNPNLYVKGRVCTSLLGTSQGRDIEVWTTNSTLLQLIVSIQGSILVADPYYIAHFFGELMERDYENSRTYNELVILKVVQSMKELVLAPPEVFADEISAYCATHGEKMCNRLERWCDDSDPLKPEFPLLPVSKGLKLSLTFALKSFKDVLNKTNSASNAQSVPTLVNCVCYNCIY